MTDPESRRIHVSTAGTLAVVDDSVLDSYRTSTAQPTAHRLDSGARGSGRTPTNDGGHHDSEH